MSLSPKLYDEIKWAYWPQGDISKLTILSTEELDKKHYGGEFKPGDVIYEINSDYIQIKKFSNTWTELKKPKKEIKAAILLLKD